MTRALEIVAANALGIGAASFASVSGTGFGNGNEVTELVEVPRSYFGERDGNIASKDIAESPTASPERPEKKDNSQQTTDNRLGVQNSEFKVQSSKFKVHSTFSPFHFKQTFIFLF